MTNGEKIKEIFPSAIVERADEGRFVQVIYSYFKAFYPIDWWNAEYKEPRKGYWYVDERPESDREVICSNCEQSIFK